MTEMSKFSDKKLDNYWKTLSADDQAALEHFVAHTVATLAIVEDKLSEQNEGHIQYRHLKSHQLLAEVVRGIEGGWDTLEIYRDFHQSAKEHPASKPHPGMVADNLVAPKHNRSRQG